VSSKPGAGHVPRLYGMAVAPIVCVLLIGDSSDYSRTDVNMNVFPALQQDRRGFLRATVISASRTLVYYDLGRVLINAQIAALRSWRLRGVGQAHNDF
jgi:hypothetical protein